MRASYSLKMFTVFSFIAFLAWSHSAVAFEGSFKQKMSLDEKVIAQFNVTVKDKNVRMEILNNPSPEMVIENSEGYYRIFPARQMAVKMPKVEKHNFLDDLGDFQGYLNKNQAEKKGEEKIGEIDTELFEYVDPMSREKAKAWLTKDKHLPLKIEVPTPPGHLKIEFSDYLVEQPVSEDAFKIPEGLKVVDQKELIAETAQAARLAAQKISPDSAS